MIRQATSEVPRIGAIENAEVKAGKRSARACLEVAKLGYNTNMLLGMDLFDQLGFGLNNLPFSWPEEEKVEIEVKSRKKIPEVVEMPPGVGEDGIAEEWRQVLADNAALPEGNVCKLPEAILDIPTGDSKPVYVRQYPIPQALVERVRERIKQWDAAGITIEAPWNCPYNIALLCADKPAKEIGEKDDVRVCLDARALNERIVESPDSSMPLLRDVLDRLGEFQWISVIDLADSYHQFPLSPEDQQKTCFTFEGKRRMFTVVPFGLKIMTGHMQKFMEMMLGDLGVAPFQDDVAIASKTTEEHIVEVKKVLERLTYIAGLRLRLKKCKFFKTEARVLGFIVSRTGIRMDPKKVDAILNWPQPATGKGIQKFMGAVSFNRDFSHELAKIAAPLDECRNFKIIEWTEKQIRAFREVKEFVAKDIELRHVQWDKEMIMTSDACQVGIGAYIGQRNEKGELLPVICASKKLTKTQQRWPATKRELYAMMWAMNKFRHYLLGRHFIARVDHKPLVALLKNRVTLLTEGWMDTILKFDFTTEHLPGNENVLADALSRCYEDEMTVDVNAARIGDDVENIKSVSPSVHMNTGDELLERNSNPKLMSSIEMNDKAEEESVNEQGLLWEAELRGLELVPVAERKALIEKTHALGHFGAKSM
jgi:hypothetical protein